MSEIFWRSKFWLEKKFRPWMKRSLIGVEARDVKIRAGSKRDSSLDDNSGYCLSDKDLDFFDQVDW